MINDNIYKIKLKYLDKIQFNIDTNKFCKCEINKDKIYGYYPCIARGSIKFNFNNTESCLKFRINDF
jgi:hypothetical protein